jgi:hypothetical protein
VNGSRAAVISPWSTVSGAAWISENVGDERPVMLDEPPHRALRHFCPPVPVGATRGSIPGIVRHDGLCAASGGG